jgi:hypothetical protein
MQQINLYRPIFRRQEKKFSAAAMLQAGTAIVVGIFVIYGLLWWQVRDLRQELQQANRQVAASAKRLEEAVSRFGPSRDGALLADEVTQLEARVAERRRLRDMLRRDLLASGGGYSDFLVAFARRHLPGIWLTAFEIKGSGEHLRLEGAATDPALVPQYVQRLAAEPVLAGKEFRVFVLSRPEARADRAGRAAHVEFLLRTGPDGGRS